MLATTPCRDSANSGDKGYFRRFRGMHPGRMPCEGVRPQIVRDKMGHVDIDVTHFVYSKT